MGARSFVKRILSKILLAFRIWLSALIKSFILGNIIVGDKRLDLVGFFLVGSHPLPTFPSLFSFLSFFCFVFSDSNHPHYTKYWVDSTTECISIVISMDAGSNPSCSYFVISFSPVLGRDKIQRNPF